MKTAAVIRIVLISVFGYLFLNWIGSSAEESAFVQQPWLWVILAFFILFYIAGEISIEALRSILYRSLKADEQAKYDEHLALEKDNQFRWLKRLYKKLLGSRPIEEEGEIISITIMMG